MRNLLLVSVAALGLWGCAESTAESGAKSTTPDVPKGTWANEARQRAAFDLNCQEINLVYIKKADWSGGPVFGARGCGKHAAYKADTMEGVRLNSPVLADDPAPSSATPTPH